MHYVLLTVAERRCLHPRNCATDILGEGRPATVRLRSTTNQGNAFPNYAPKGLKGRASRGDLKAEEWIAFAKLFYHQVLLLLDRAITASDYSRDIPSFARIGCDAHSPASRRSR
jgi:hypothetical protein